MENKHSLNLEHKRENKQLKDLKEQNLVVD